MSDTKIEWATKVWNPLTGCTKVSPGCNHCYAETFAERFRGVPGHPFENGFDLTLRPGRLRDPLKWKSPQRIFVNSMSDLFHRDVPDDFIEKVFATMYEGAHCPHRHTFMVLTKRPERMRRIVASIHDKWNPAGAPGPRPYMPEGIWLGVSIESNDYAWRADMLRETPAAVRFLSIEPMLGAVDRVDLTGIDWVIVGGESGRGARPMHPDWVRGVRDRCVAAGIAFFFKQRGEWTWGGGYHDGSHLLNVDGRFVTRESGTTTTTGAYGVRTMHDLVDRGHPGWVRVRRVGKGASGRDLDGRTWDEFPVGSAVLA